MTRARTGGGRFRVDGAASDMRLDSFVGRSLGVSVAEGRRLIATGAVRVDGRPAPKGARVIAGAVVDIESHADRAAPVLPDGSLAIRFIYEDEDLVAIDKPAGVPSHPLLPDELGTVANAVVLRYPECAAASTDAREGGLGHRLDTATSGVLIAARSRHAWQALRRALGAGTCEKRYLCEVWGAPPETGGIDAEIGRVGRRGRRVRTDGGRHPRPAETRWTVIARGSSTTLIEARLHSGRPHQVRVHLASAGFPIVGDDRYGAKSASGAVPGAQGAVEAAVENAAEPSRLHLHAVSVRLVHPTKGTELLIEAPPPAWAAVFVRAL